MELIERISVTEDDVMDARKKLSTTAQKPDLICIGCPHASLDEIEKIAEKISGRKLSTPFWVCTSIPVKAAADRMGYTKTIENAGGKLICDTCMVVSPIEDLGFKVIGVDSAKAANYVPTMCGLDVVYDEFEDLIE